MAIDEEALRIVGADADQREVDRLPGQRARASSSRFCVR
jgi:hypothetical protein